MPSQPGLTDREVHSHRQHPGTGAASLGGGSGREGGREGGKTRNAGTGRKTLSGAGTGVTIVSFKNKFFHLSWENSKR